MSTHLPQTPGEYIGVLKRRKRAIIVSGLLTAAVVGAIYPFIPRYYASTASLMVTDDTITPMMTKGKGEEANAGKRLKSFYSDMAIPENMEILAQQLGVADKYKDVHHLKGLVGQMKRKLTVGMDSSGIVTLTYAARSPQEAQKGANAIADSAVLIDRRMREEEAKNAIAFIEDQLNIYKARISDSEKTFYTNQISNQLDDLMKKRSMILDQIYDLEKTNPAVIKDENPAVYKIQTELSEQQSRLAQMAVSVKEDSPMMREVRQRISELESALSAEKERSAPDITSGSASSNPAYASALRDLRQVNADIAFLKKRQQAFQSGDTVVSPEEVESKEREQHVDEDIYNSLLRGLQSAQLDLRLADSGSQGGIQVLERGELPTAPSWPLAWQGIVAALVLGLMVGVAVAILKEIRDTSIRGVDDAQRALRVPVVACIPKLIDENRSPKNPWDIRVAPEVVALTDSQSLATEHFRLLRTRLLSIAQKRPMQTIVVTSALAGDGKTTTCINTAILMATEMEKRVAIVDCDIRQSSVARYLGLPQKNGLFDLLSKGGDVESVLKGTRLDRLTVITAGDSVPNPAKLLGSERLKQVWADLRRRFDFIFVDAPPMVPLADVPMLTGIADGILMVAAVGRTPRRFIQDAIGSFEHIPNAALLGLVLTGVESHLPTYMNQYFNANATVGRARA